MKFVHFVWGDHFQDDFYHLDCSTKQNAHFPQFPIHPNGIESTGDEKGKKMKPVNIALESTYSYIIAIVAGLFTKTSTDVTFSHLGRSPVPGRRRAKSAWRRLRSVVTSSATSYAKLRHLLKIKANRKVGVFFLVLRLRTLGLRRIHEVNSGRNRETLKRKFRINFDC